MDKLEWKALNAISFMRTLIVSFFSVFVPIYMLQNGLSPADVSLAIGMGMGMRLLVAPLIGTLTDLVGTRRLLQLSLVGMAAGAAGLAMSQPQHPTLVEFIPPIALLWSSSTALIVSLEASLYKKTTGGEVAGHAGEYNALKAVAWGLSLLVSGFLLLTTPFTTIALALALLSLLAIGLTNYIQHTVRVGFDLQDYLHELRKPTVALLSLLIFIQAFEWGTEGVALPTIYLRQGGLDSAGVGLVSFGADMALALASFWVGRQVARHHRGAQIHMIGSVLVGGMVVAGAGCFLIVLTHDLEGLMAARAIYNIGEAMIGISFGFIIGNTFAPTHVGGANGVMNLICNAGMMVAALAAGVLIGFGMGVPYLVSGSLFIIGAILAGFVMRRMG